MFWRTFLKKIMQFFQLMQLTYIVLIDPIVNFPYVNFTGYVYVFMSIKAFFNKQYAVLVPPKHFVESLRR